MRRRMMMSGGTTDATSGYYTIDQSGTYSSPSAMIVDKKVAVLREIRKNSHLYVGELVNGVLQCKQVSDDNKSFYADGTTVTYTSTQNLFMKLPQFWWKCETLDDNGDIVKISFTTEQPQDGNWFEWGGDTFIGVYKGSVESVDGVNMLRSVTGVAATSGITYNNFKQYSINCGRGFSLITYEAHQIMILLGYGYLGTLNSQEVCGFGAPKSGIINGTCDSIGMTDTINSSDTDNPLSGNIKGINYWGLENWWGYYWEYLDNIYTYKRKLILTDINNNQVRTIDSALVTSSGYCVKKLIFGDYGDTICKQQTGATKYNIFFCDEYLMLQSDNQCGMRGGYNPSKDIGLLALRFQTNKNTTNAERSTRLQYKGNYEIIA